MKATKTYKDLDLSFIAHPTTKDVPMKYDENAIKASLKNLILTRNFERPFHSEIGSQVTALLFENYTPLTEITLRTSIENVIRNFEPRVNLEQVNINNNPDQNAVDVTIYFRIMGLAEVHKYSISLERTR